MNFTEFKKTCVGKQCKIIQSEMFCPDAKHPTYKSGWNDISAQHKFLNAPRTIEKITNKQIQVGFKEGFTSYIDLESCKDFLSTEKGFSVTNTKGVLDWGMRLTYEWIENK